MAPNVTSSRNRAARQKQSKAVVRQGQNPQRANRQSQSTAQVTKGGEGVGSGRGAAKVTQSKTGNALGAAMQIAGTVKSLATRGGAAGLVMKPTPTADGTLKAAQRRGDYKPKQGPANPDQGKTKAQSFDDAFRKARKAGQQEFTWNDKRYSTRRADGK